MDIDSIAARSLFEDNFAKSEKQARDMGVVRSQVIEQLTVRREGHVGEISMDGSTSRTNPVLQYAKNNAGSLRLC